MVMRNGAVAETFHVTRKLTHDDDHVTIFGRVSGWSAPVVLFDRYPPDAPVWKQR